METIVAFLIGIALGCLLGHLRATVAGWPRGDR
jgi:hypothetical protein